MKSIPRLAPRFALGSACVFAATQAMACATCFGRSDSRLAEGMNMGILTLLGVVGAVLAGCAGFVVFLARRSARLTAPPAGDQPAATNARS